MRSCRNASRITVRPRVAGRRSREGFTLLELVIALALAALVTAAPTSATVQVFRSQRFAKKSINDHWERAYVLDQFMTDMRSTLKGLPKEVETIRINESQTQLLRVLGLTSVHRRGSLFRTRLPAVIEYIVEPSDGGGRRKKLVRNVHDLTKTDQEPDRYVIGKGLFDVRVEQLGSSGWQETGVSADDEEPKLIAYRLICRWEMDEDEFDVRTVLLSDRRPAEGTRK